MLCSVSLGIRLILKDPSLFPLFCEFMTLFLVFLLIIYLQNNSMLPSIFGGLILKERFPLFYLLIMNAVARSLAFVTCVYFIYDLYY